MDLGLTDRVYLATGASRGLGRAAAEVLVAEGARVVLSGRSQEALDAAVDALGDGAVGVAADNADPSTPERLVRAARERWGRLDGALVSVGGPALGGVTEITDEQWRTAFDTVFLGAVRLGRVLAGELGEGGSIVFVLSTSVRAPLPNLAVSNGLRPGLAMVAKTLADDLAPRGIRVNGLLPGAIRTERLAELGSPPPDPVGRHGEPAEFGRVAAFLLSPAASYVSGAMVPVDGGATRAL
jgi:3-oxoacyl-[acyl-carrier protein] reductase